MRWFRRRSIRARLTALVLVASAVLIGALSTLLLVNEGRQSSRRLDRDLKRRGNAIELSLRKNRKFPYAEPYGEAIDADYQIIGMSQAVELRGLLTADQVDFVLKNGDLQFRREDDVLGGASRFLAQRRLVSGVSIVTVVGASEEVLHQSRTQLRLALAIGGPLLVSALGLGGWVLAGAILRPVRRMTDDASAITNFDVRGDSPNQRLEVGEGSDELTHLGSTLNSMLARLEESYRRERAFVDDASHELRTPLAIARGELELALLEPDSSPTTVAALQRSMTEVDRVIQLATDLLIVARARSAGVDSPNVATTKLNQSVRRIVERFENLDAVRFVGDYETSDDLAIALRADYLERIVLNLLENARRYARSEVRIDCRVAHNAAELTVTDDGPGFDPSFLPRVFDRFAVASESRTRPLASEAELSRTHASGGVGLGLAIVADLVRNAGGEVEASNRADRSGAIVRVTFPCGAATAGDAVVTAPI